MWTILTMLQRRIGGHSGLKEYFDATESRARTNVDLHTTDLESPPLERALSLRYFSPYRICAGR
jgi:hypothetical protein